VNGRNHLGRLKLTAVFCLLPFVLVIPRLFWLQIVDGGDLNRRSLFQNMSRTWIPPHRGEIRDRDGACLAFSVADTLTYGNRTRIYPYGESVAQVVGVTGPDGVGRSGIEKELDGALQGHPGWGTELRDATGKRFLFSTRPGKSETSGYDVVLTIDADLQDVAMTRLEEAVRRLKARWASLVAVDPRTGEVLAMVSWPPYDPDDTTHTADTKRRVGNRAVTEAIEPGSTFKLITAATALRERLLSPNTLIHCENGSYRIGRRTIHDHKPFGILPFHACFAHSSNIAFSKVGETCGRMLYDTAREFRFGSATGIRLPGESNGRLPREWKPMTPASMAMGYEVMATELQITMAYAAVANDGVLMRPYILKSLLDSSGKEVFTNLPEPRSRVVEPAVCRQLKGFLAEVVEDGTGKAAALGWTRVGGKTGTTRKVVGGKYTNRHHYASFVGMAPLDDPDMVMMVVVDDPNTTYGGAAAAPIFHDVLDAYQRIPGARLSPDYVTVRTAEDGRSDKILSALLPEKAEAGTGGTKAETPGGPRGVPEVRGMALRRALQTLRSLGIKATVEGTGWVVRQVPPPGGKPVRSMRLLCEPPPARALDTVLDVGTVTSAKQ